MRAMSEQEKRHLATVIGSDLVASSGSRKFYSQQQVRSALEKRQIAVDVHCWAYSLFMCRDDFDGYHRSVGETCDYLSMKASMISAVTEHASDSWFNFDFDLSWFEWPDVDLSSLFDGIDIDLGL